jgi:hypothetical protein
MASDCWLRRRIDHLQTLTDQVFVCTPIWSNLLRRWLLRQPGKSTERLNSSCSLAAVWWVAYRGRAVAGRKTSYTLARSDQNFMHIAGLGWKLHTLWSKPTLVDGLVESSKRTSVKSLYAWCAISSNKSLKILLYNYICILQLYYLSAFEND